MEPLSGSNGDSPKSKREIDPLNIKNAEKKVREASFFLTKMTKHERPGFSAFGDKEAFDFYLSAFLNAGISVRGTFHVEQDRKRDKAVKAWKKAWEGRLTPEQRCLWNFMRKDRAHEVHRSGSSRRLVTENKELAGTHRLKSATATYNFPPNVRSSYPVPTYKFTIDGTERKVMEACEEYLTLLKQMVAKFKRDKPIP